MSPDSYQQAWQAQAAATRVSVDADALLDEAQRYQRQLRTVTAVQDYGYILFSLLAIPAWVLVGIAMAQPWTWYLMVPVALWSVGFTLFVRARHKRPPNDPDKPLLSCVQEMLAVVELQSWMGRTVYWWAVLPTFVVVLAYACHVTLLSEGWVAAFVMTALMGAVFFATFAVMFRLTQRWLTDRFEPQRRELLALLASLGDETSGEAADAPGVSPFSETRRMMRRWSSTRLVILWVILFVALLLLLLLPMMLQARVGSLFGAAADSPREPVFYAKVAPYTGVRWENDRPVVRVQEHWSPLVSIDGIPIERIMEHANQRFGERARKRLAEDLVEVLSTMRHEPGWTVTLGLETPDGQVEQLQVRMTEQNRNRVRE